VQQLKHILKAAWTFLSGVPSTDESRFPWLQLRYSGGQRRLRESSETKKKRLKLEFTHVTIYEKITTQLKLKVEKVLGG
jgi:hypothetical protein